MRCRAHAALRSALAVAALALAACARDSATAPDGGPPPGGVVDSAGSPASPGNKLAELGSRIFDDRNLSIGRNQACASCHDSRFGFTAPEAAVNVVGGVVEGSIPGRFGTRRPPSAAYASAAPPLHRDPVSGAWVGGNFWDGRATGARLGSPAADQALHPFLDTLEQALPDAACVVYRATHSTYTAYYEAAWGRQAFEIAFPANTDRTCERPGATVELSGADREAVEREFDRIALSLAAFEGSHIAEPFSSRFDAWRRGEAALTAQEARGLALFEGKARCAGCHPSQGERPLFTNYEFDNNGVPPNPANPALAADPAYRDLGLGDVTHAAADRGLQKVPTLRNVDRRPDPSSRRTYMHNGVFTSLEEVVHFYNTRDVLPRCGTGGASRVGVDCWPASEVAENVNRAALGDLGLTAEEEAAVVAFLKTLTDGYSNGAGRP